MIATMELYWNKDPKVATNVFELGLKTFGSEPEYVMQYLDFLIKSNNDSSTFSLLVSSSPETKTDISWFRQMRERCSKGA